MGASAMKLRKRLLAETDASGKPREVDELVPNEEVLGQMGMAFPMGSSADLVAFKVTTDAQRHDIVAGIDRALLVREGDSARKIIEAIDPKPSQA